MDALQLENKQYKEQMQQYSEQLTTANRQNQHIKTSLKVAEELKERTEHKLSSYDQDNKQASIVIAELLETNQQLQTKIDDAGLSNENINLQHNELLQKFNRLQKDFSNLQRENQVIQKEKEQLMLQSEQNLNGKAQVEEQMQLISQKYEKVIATERGLRTKLSEKLDQQMKKATKAETMLTNQQRLAIEYERQIAKQAKANKNLHAAKSLAENRAKKAMQKSSACDASIV